MEGCSPPLSPSPRSPATGDLRRLSCPRLSRRGPSTAPKPAPFQGALGPKDWLPGLTSQRRPRTLSSARCSCPDGGTGFLPGGTNRAGKEVARSKLPWVGAEISRCKSGTKAVSASAFPQAAGDIRGFCLRPISPALEYMLSQVWETTMSMRVSVSLLAGHLESPLQGPSSQLPLQRSEPHLLVPRFPPLGTNVPNCFSTGARNLLLARETAAAKRRERTSRAVCCLWLCPEQGLHLGHQGSGVLLVFPAAFCLNL